jgi:hypothetical protein
MSDLYKRACSLVIGDASGNAIDLSAFRVKFVIKQALIQTPKHADITVYNLRRETALQIQKEFTTVELHAGYEGGSGLIFRGSVIQVRIGRENATDSYLHILATHHDAAYNFAVSARTLGAGWTQADAHAGIASDFASRGVAVGSAPSLSATPAPRGKVCFGQTRDLARQFAEANGAHWNIDNDQLQVCRVDQALPDPVFVLTSKTGLIGLPAMTIDGVVARSLLRSEIRAGARVQIDNASIQDVSISPSIDFVNVFPSKAADDVYKIYYVTHTGDTRGQPWYTDMVGVSTASIPAFSDLYLNAVVSNGS